jgi:hypothetical protein
LGRLEGDRSFLAALRAHSGGFDALVALPAQHVGAFRLAGLAALGFVLEAFVREEELFAGGEHEFGAAVDALQGLILVFHNWLPFLNGASPAALVGGEHQHPSACVHPHLSEAGSVLFVSGLLSAAFASQRLLDPSLFSRFQVEGMFLDLLDDVFLLNLSLEPTKRVF